MFGDRSKPQGYSKAFSNIVQGEDDVVGLLAYALFKRAIREDAEQGRHSPGNSREPSRTVVETYRQAAERMLSDVVNASLEEARPELQRSAAVDAVENTRLALINHVSARTSFGAALLTNIVAWGFTLFVTVMILLAARGDGPEQTLATAGDRLLGPGSGVRTTPPEPQPPASSPQRP